MQVSTFDHATREWAVAQARAGVAPSEVLVALRARGMDEDNAGELLEDAIRSYLEEHARENGPPVPTRVPAPLDANGATRLRAADRYVTDPASPLPPRVIVFGGLLSHRDCRQPEQARAPATPRSPPP